MFTIGDIVSIYCPIAGYVKYHLCVSSGADGGADQFLFLNSDPNFQGTLIVACDRVACLPRSPTGVTAFSFTMVPRYNERQLELYKAKKLGTIDCALARELREFASKALNIRALNRKEAVTVCAALRSMAEGE